MKFLLPKLREELATALNAIFVHISMSYFNLQWKIHEVVAHCMGLAIISLYLVSCHCPHQFLGSHTKLIV